MMACQRVVVPSSFARKSGAHRPALTNGAAGPERAGTADEIEADLFAGFPVRSREDRVAGRARISDDRFASVLQGGDETVVDGDPSHGLNPPG